MLIRVNVLLALLIGGGGLLSLGESASDFCFWGCAVGGRVRDASPPPTKPAENKKTMTMFPQQLRVVADAGSV